MILQFLLQIFIDEIKADIGTQQKLLQVELQNKSRDLSHAWQKKFAELEEGLKNCLCTLLFSFDLHFPSSSFERFIIIHSLDALHLVIS